MWYKVKQVAEMLQLNPETIKRMIYRGEISASKVGRQWRIHSDEIQRIKEGK